MGALDSLTKVADSLVGTFGKSVTVTTYTEAYDPATGGNTLTPTPVTVKAIVEDYPARDAKGGETSGDGIVRGDRKVTIAADALSAAPTTDATVTIGGTLFNVLKIDTQFATENAALYVLQCRR